MRQKITALVVLTLTTSIILIYQERRNATESTAALKALSELAAELSRVTIQHELAVQKMKRPTMAIENKAQLEKDTSLTIRKESTTPTEEDRMIRYVFVAGIEGTGHHWYKSLFQVCGNECQPTKVGPLAWQQAAAVFLSKMDTEQVASRLAAQAAEAELARPKAPILYALNVLGGLNDAAMDSIKKVGASLAWTQGEGMMSYPNWWSSPNKAVQMPDITKIAHALTAAAAKSINQPQLKIILTTRNPHSIVKSVCEKRNFGREAGGCATEIAMLVLGANALTSQIHTLPPAPKSRCMHFELESMQQAKPEAIDKLAHYLGFHNSLVQFRSFASSVNKRHTASSGNAGRPLRASWRDALASHLSQAQRTLIHACQRHV
eukprot:CAMPEP_0197297752 /NCGR_PEP_ID=MMETSP0890-20130614/41912_1 /TAXON_ID=44058 ORGANISM="Aureoumbra lagunensis, Strain CCMP1510" /NCGR_SAMPLE_ID=MMETSP0890 /ASSEMBLY_ACC=CAM_ASM_000533 /LENGTH=377 /DNA_ID=CAMNT_0042775093 /DNA_START=76 /DNA_END=1209 /DNA_ORIENTATION=+